MAKSVARDLAFVKSKVISRLLESDEFAKVMLRKEDFTDDEKNDMEYKQVFDYPYVDGTQEEVMPFVCVETVCRGTNRTVTSMADVLTDIIERLLRDSDNLGIGKPSLDDISYTVPQSSYYGRQLKYSIPDFKIKEV